MALNAVSEFLLQRMLSMTQSDISVLEVGLAQAGAQPDLKMTTSSGSDNDKLWSEMEKLGWMVIQNEELTHNSSDVALNFRVARITQQGRQPIAELLDAHLNRRDSQARTGQAAPGPPNRPPWIASGICERFVERLCEQICSEGGDTFDLSLMLARVVLLAMGGCVPTSSQPEVVDRLRLVTKQRLAQTGESTIRRVPANLLAIGQPVERYSERQLTSMTAVHNRNCPQFVAELVKQVKEGGGKVNDLLSTVAFVVALCIGAAITPEERDAAVENVFGAVRNMLAAV